MICSRCKVDKDPGEFIHGKTKCLKCYRKMQEYYQQNRGREIERAKRSQNANRVKTNARKRAGIRKNPVSYLLWQVKARAKKKGIPFNLTHEDIVIPASCPVLGIPLKINEGHSGFDSPSIDRVVPELGYVRGNVQIISHRANTIKNDATLAELKSVVAYLESLAV